jgi:TPR repeat protein
VARAGRFFIQYNNRYVSTFGKRILLAAAELGDPSALFAVYLLKPRSEKELDKQNHMKASFAQLLSPVEANAMRKQLQNHAEHGNAVAMTILGQTAERNRSIPEAIRFYTQAAEIEHEAYKFNDRRFPTPNINLPVALAAEGAVEPLPLAHPGSYLGHLYILRKNIDMARKYLKQAAIEGDDPYAYHELASIELSLQKCFTADWFMWTTKAAVAGHPDAMVSLGDFYGISDDSIKANPKLLDSDTRIERQKFNKRSNQPWEYPDRNKKTRKFNLPGRVYLAMEWYTLAIFKNVPMAAVSALETLSQYLSGSEDLNEVGYYLLSFYSSHEDKTMVLAGIKNHGMLREKLKPLVETELQ